MKSHKDLDVWRAAIDMAQDIYELTRTYLNEEQYGIINQMRRSAVSIASIFPKAQRGRAQRSLYNSFTLR